METLRVTTDNGNYNANFYLLAPVYTPPESTALAVSNANGNSGLNISFPTQPGYSYQLEYKTNLTDAAWIPLGVAIPGDGTIHSANVCDRRTAAAFIGCKSSESKAEGNFGGLGISICFLAC